MTESNSLHAGDRVTIVDGLDEAYFVLSIDAESESVTLLPTSREGPVLTDVPLESVM